MVPPSLSRSLRVLVAVAMLASVFVAVRSDDAAAALPTAPAVLPQLWGVEIDDGALDALDARTLKRMRAARLTLIAGEGLGEAQAQRLEQLARKRGLRVFRPVAAPDAASASAFCVQQPPARSRCGVRTPSVAAARAVLSGHAADVVVVGARRGAVRSLRKARGGGRLIAAVALRAKGGHAGSWRAVIRMASTSRSLDVAVVPQGRKVGLALRRFAGQVRRYARGDRRSPGAPKRLRAKAGGPASVVLSWKPSKRKARPAGYGLFRDGVRIRSMRRPKARVGKLSCAVHRFAVDAVDRAGNRSRKRAASAAPAGCGGDAPNPGRSAPAPLGVTAAHLWIDGNGGSCTRSAAPVAYADGAACASAEQAYGVANASADETIVGIKGGTYPGFAIAGTRGSSNRIVFDAARGETPVFAGGMIDVGNGDTAGGAVNYVTLRNLTTAEFGPGAKNPDNRFGVYVAPHSTYVRLENLRAGNFLIQGAQNVEVVGGEYGPCRAADTGQDCEINKVDHYPGSPTPSNILIDGVYFHDYDLGPSCFGSSDGGSSAGSPDCHWRAMYLNGVHNLTLRNSRFRESFIAPWTTISGPDAARVGNKNILIENNVFGTGVNYGSGNYSQRSYGRWESFDFAWCENASSGVYAYDGVTYRFNSASRAVGVFALFNESGCQGRVRDIKVYGNVGFRNGCDALIEYAYNVYSNDGTCAPSDRNADAGGALPFYAADTHSPGPLDYRLSGPASPADNLVPAGMGCPATDHVGNPRGQGGVCDAGAYER